MHGHKAAQHEEPGVLITHVRLYNVLLAVLFAGRRGSLDATMAAASGAAPGDRVLDVGCGPGHFARRLAEVVGPRGEVVGVDPSQPMIDYARSHAGKAPNCHFEVAAAQALGLPDAAFAVVTSTFVVHHIPPEKRATALEQMHRVLRPGGRLLIADVYPTGQMAPRLASLLGRLTLHRAPGPEGHPSVDPFTDTNVRLLAIPLRELGFSGLEFTDIRPWTRYVTATKNA
ncbi:class I SAM-dependent methyltransferase [Streptomyces sp. NPDC002896]|uniref:class I SAM-dependent methyltransferase n=1 Tax=Streptomyces sp. NPDC002896 TaxID=3154438 RepID=UPI00332BAFBA